jgi:hypothetical protein
VSTDPTPTPTPDPDVIVIRLGWIRRVLRPVVWTGKQLPTVGVWLWLAWLTWGVPGCPGPIPDPTPAPTPGPEPGPEPTPAPVSAPLILAYCVDASRATPTDSAVATDAALRNALAGLATVFRVFQSDEQDIAAKGLQQYAGKLGYPFGLLYRADTGAVVSELSRPSAVDLLNAVKAARGKL